MPRKPAMSKAIQEAELKHGFRQEFDQSISDRIKRYMEIDSAWMIPNHHFAAVSAECKLVYRDGHYYSCIALVQSVAEALVRFLCERNGWRAGGDYEKNIKTLTRRRKIAGRLASKFRYIWKTRNDYHHLNTSILRDRVKLSELAKNTMKSLADIEKEIFAFNIRNGKIVPKNKKLWSECEDKAFLMMDKQYTRWVFEDKKTKKKTRDKG